MSLTGGMEPSLANKRMDFLALEAVGKLGEHQEVEPDLKLLGEASRFLSQSNLNPFLVKSLRQASTTSGS